MSTLLPLLLGLWVGPASAADCPKDATAWAKWRKAAVQAAKSLDEVAEAGQFIQKCETDPLTAGPFADPLLGACLSPIKKFGAGFRNQDRWGDSTRLPSEYSPEEIAFLGGEKPTGRGIHEKENEGLGGLSAPPPGSFDLAALKTLMNQFPGSRAIKRNNSLIVVLPGSKRDRWYSLNAYGVMQIDIHKKDDQGKSYFLPVSYFSNEPFAKLGANEEAASCTKCHMTGAIPMLERSDTAGKFSAVFPKQDVNATIKAMSKLAKKTAHAVPAALNYQDYGPPFGPVDPPTRTHAFIEQCAQTPGLSKAVVGKLKVNMNCASCHNGKLYSVLNAPIGIAEKLSLAVLASGHMPPGTEKQLSDKERGMLRDCLLKEYYGPFSGGTEPGTFQRWLLTPACPAEPTPKPEASPTPDAKAETTAVPEIKSERPALPY